MGRTPNSNGIQFLSALMWTAISCIASAHRTNSSFCASITFLTSFADVPFGAKILTLVFLPVSLKSLSIAQKFLGEFVAFADALIVLPCRPSSLNLPFDANPNGSR